MLENKDGQWRGRPHSIYLCTSAQLTFLVPFKEAANHHLMLFRDFTSSYNILWVACSYI